MNEGPSNRNETPQIMSYFHDIPVICTRYAQNIKEYLEPFRDLLNLKISELEGSEARSILILSPYGSKENLKKAAINKREKIRSAQDEISQVLKSMENIISSGIIKCTQCRGQGKIVKMKYIREGEVVTPILGSSECPACRGSGLLKLTDEQRDYFRVMKEIVNIVNNIGMIFLNTLDDLVRADLSNFLQAK